MCRTVQPKVASPTPSPNLVLTAVVHTRCSSGSSPLEIASRKPSVSDSMTSRVLLLGRRRASATSSAKQPNVSSFPEEEEVVLSPAAVPSPPLAPRVWDCSEVEAVASMLVCSW